MLISTFTDFSSEGIDVCSGWITIEVCLAAIYKFTDAPTKLFDAPLESASNSISEESRKVGPVLAQYNGHCTVNN